MTEPNPTEQRSGSARERLAAVMAKGGEHIGDLVWPELRLAGRNLDRGELRSWLSAEGLPESWAPPDPSGQKCFGKALGRVTNLEAAPNVSVERERVRSRVALVRYSVGAGLHKRTETWARVWVSDLDELEVDWSGDQTVQDALSGEVASTVLAHVQVAIAKLRSEFNGLMNAMDTAELGEMVVNVLVDELGAVRVRRDGGLYYVPTSQSEKLRAFARVIAQAGDSALPFLPAFDTPEGREHVGRSVRETLVGEVQAVVNGLNRLGGEDGAPRESALQRRLDELDSLRVRAETCKIVLASFGDDVASALASAKARVLELMDLGDDLDEEG